MQDYTGMVFHKQLADSTAKVVACCCMLHNVAAARVQPIGGVQDKKLPALIHHVLLPFTLHCFVFECFDIAGLALNLFLHSWPDFLVLHCVEVAVIVENGRVFG